MSCGSFLMASYLRYLKCNLERHKRIFVHLRDNRRI